MSWSLHRILAIVLKSLLGLGVLAFVWFWGHALLVDDTIKPRNAIVGIAVGLYFVLIFVSPLIVAWLGARWAHRRGRLEWAWSSALTVVYLGIAAWCSWIWNPLPSDEEMIENFQAHRADFVEVVRRYREYPRPPGTIIAFWYREGDTLELFRRAGIDNVDHAGSTPWLPNPYSLETAMGMKNRGKEMGPFGLFYRYGALRIQPATTPRINHPDLTDHRRHYWNTLLYGTIWKDYFFFPEVPRIESGMLLGPLTTVGKGARDAVFHEKEGVATWQYSARVLPTLNRLPSDLKGFECVYRQIEPQWFIRLCNGRH